MGKSRKIFLVIICRHKKFLHILQKQFLVVISTNFTLNICSKAETLNKIYDGEQSRVYY